MLFSVHVLTKLNRKILTAEVPRANKCRVDNRSSVEKHFDQAVDAGLWDDLDDNKCWPFPIWPSDQSEHHQYSIKHIKPRTDYVFALTVNTLSSYQLSCKFAPVSFPKTIHALIPFTFSWGFLGLSIACHMSYISKWPLSYFFSFSQVIQEITTP